MRNFRIQRPENRLVFLLLLVSFGGMMLLAAAVSTVAQDSSPAVFATNTPQPSPAPLPEGYKELYALPQWLERDMLDILVDYLGQIKPGDSQSQLAVQLIQHELERRFPGAPHQQADRERVLEAMMAAPRGSVDMRTIVRPFVEEVLNRQDIRGLTTYQGFQIEILLTNLDGVDPVDVIIHTQYPADAVFPADILYEDYTLAVVDGSGYYRMLDSSPYLPAAPFGSLEHVALEEVGDVNQDGVEEMVLSLEQNDAVNNQMLIYGLRNGVFLNLIADPTLEFGNVAAWSTDPVSLAVTRLRLESPAWGCLSQIEANYDYTANLFRPVVVDPNRKYANQDSLACRLYEAEPLFSIPPSEAIETVEDILAQSSRDEPDSEYAAQRAEMVLAMLYALDGQPSAAVDMASNLEPEAAPGSWLKSQVSAFLSGMGQAGVTAIDLCAGLMSASEYGACDINQVLEQALAENPPNRDEPLLDQLAARGLTVLETTTISEIGHVDRLAVNFDLYGASWWAFAPLKPDAYVAEQVDAPPGFEAAFAPVGFLEAPQSAYDALLRDGDITKALSIADSAVQSNPDLPLSPAIRYLQALSLDLLADRMRARDAYFDLWKDFPTTLWGQLAAAHLERR